MDELIEQFLIEGRELVQQASDDLLALEENPSDAGRIDSAFRAVHTLKGSVGFFDFAPMGELLHRAEDLLGAIRDGRMTAAGPIIDVLLDCIGASDTWIDSIERTGALPPDADALGRGLRAVMAWPASASSTASRLRATRLATQYRSVSGAVTAFWPVLPR